VKKDGKRNALQARRLFVKLHIDKIVVSDDNDAQQNRREKTRKKFCFNLKNLCQPLFGKHSPKKQKEKGVPEESKAAEPNTYRVQSST
jgi:hypothetical protein